MPGTIVRLAGFRGTLQVDGYVGYRALAETGTVELAFCWSHVRRRFYEIAAAGPTPIANQALPRIAELYAVDGRDADARRAVRQDRTKPILDSFKSWLEAQLSAVSQKAAKAGAIRYTLGRWTRLTCFLDDGRIELDSNTVERAIRPIALNRKNALFDGSDSRGEHWAILASLIETCKLNGLDPQAWLTDVFGRLVGGHPINRLDELLPLGIRRA